MLWGEKLWDKFDIVEKHTEKGIQFSRRVVQFFEEYASKKREHAQQMRKLVKQYNVNYKKGNPTGAAGKKGGVKETKDYSYETAFYVMLEHVNEMATLEETMASDLEEKIILTAKHRHNDFMSKRKQFLSAGRDHNVRLSNSLKFLENAENNFKKACKARDEAQTAFTKADNDMNVTKALVAKCEQTLKTKTDLMENSKQEYLQQLKQTNDAQHDHFFEQMPLVFSDLETLDTDRIQDLQSLIHDFANLHENYQPHLSKCLLAVHQCAEDMNVDEDLELVVTRHESTLFPPGDRTFIDYSNPNAIHDAPSNISPTSQRPQVQPRSSKTQTTTSTLSSNEGGGAHQNNTSPCSTQSLPGADASMAADATYNSSNSSGNTNSGGDPKCVTLAPSLNNNNNPPVTGKDKDKKKRGRFLSFMSKKSKTFNPNNQPNLLQEFSDIPFVNEAPPQQRMKTEAKIVELEREIEKLEREREGMLKLKTSYANNTAYGDAKSLEPKIARVGQELDSRRLELKRYTEFLTAISTGLTRPARANSSAAQNRISRDYQSGSGGEYGESSSNYYAGGAQTSRCLFVFRRRGSWRQTSLQHFDRWRRNIGRRRRWSSWSH
ncbi:formin-binding protein 1-like isoform X2 [Convolutriloba macropyga]|uniref:formin-binding protein 1-like isoform X2 n=1 Tax=Convolutriloba macropyga TaxID=536237 RepID=UPI003F520512